MRNYITFLQLLAIILTTKICKSQDTLFFKKLGDSSGDEEIENIITISDGNLISIGMSDSYSSNGDADAIIIKSDINGNVLWTKTHGNSFDNMLLDIKELNTGEFIACGWTVNNGVDYDFWIVKLDNQGNIVWEKQYGGSGDEQAWSVDLLLNDYIVVGGTDSYGAGLTDVWAMRIDNNGNIIWQNTYGSSSDDAPPGSYEEYVARSFVDNNNRIIIGGLSNGTPSNSYDIFTLKLDAQGNILWQYAYGDVDEEAFWNFTSSYDGNYYYLSGNTNVPSTQDGEMWLVKIDTTGNIVWQKSFGNTGTWDEILNISSSNDGVILSSYIETNSNDWSGALLKVNNQGNLIWSNKYKMGDLDWINDAKALSDGTIAIAGVTTNTTVWNQDYLFIRVNTSGTISGCNLITAYTPNVNTTNTTKQNINFSKTSTSTNSIVINSTTQTLNLLSSSSNCSEIISSINEWNIDKQEIYPNPANSFIEVPIVGNVYNYEIYNLTGKLIMKEVNYNQKRINITNLSNGVYFIKISSQNQTDTATYKIIKI
ncbi:MAG: hypothetical protein Kow0079_11430 [Vicingaceae bacterium]